MTRKSIMAGFGFIAVLLIAGLVVAFVWPKGDDLRLPVPNGYDDFLQGAAMLPGAPTNYLSLPAGELRPLIQESSAGLLRARSGFSNECRVPVQHSQAYVNNHLPELSGIRELGRWFRASGRLAELENDASAAADRYLETMELGHKAVQGGLLIDVLVGLACERMGLDGLTNVLRQLDAARCREVTRQIEEFERGREPFDRVIERERKWSRRAFGVTAVFAAVFQKRAIQAAHARVQQKVDAHLTLVRSFLMEAAARACELEHGKPPLRTSDLVPEYLKAVPKDPVTGTEMELKR